MGSLTCLTAVPGKVKERVLLGTVASQLKQMTENRQHISRFTKGKSCLTNLITFYDKITSNSSKEGREEDQDAKDPALKELSLFTLGNRRLVGNLYSVTVLKG